MAKTITRRGWRMTGPGVMSLFEDTLPAPRPGFVNVEVVGCGVCHTDVGFLYGDTRTVAPNVVLGHEIVGWVLGDDGERERLVIVPAVSPCGECPTCRRGRRTACAASLMPGNHHDGGFATHAQVPSRWLCDIPPLPAGLEPWQLAAVADAMTTAHQAVVRSELRGGDVAVVVGAGGVGGFLVELARARGATVAALDVNPASLMRAATRGARLSLDVKNLKPKDVKEALKPLDDGKGRWHVYECSGTAAGQTLAWALLTRGSTISIVGFSPEPVQLRLSNLMALDAEAFGNWGCDPALFPDALAHVVRGEVDLAGAVERKPLSAAPTVLAAAHHGELTRRAVLVPDAEP